MSSVAKNAGVSSATVSRVMSGKHSAIPISRETREKVMAVAKKMGYQPNLLAKSLRTRRSLLVGVVLWDLTDPFFSEILRGIEQVLDQHGYNLLLTSAQGAKEREAVCLEKLMNFRADGILIVGGTKSVREDEILELGIDRGTVVLIGTRTESMDISSVTVDNVSGGYIGAEYLIRLNRGSLIYIAGEDKTVDMEDRLLGVRKAVAKHGFQDRFSVIEAGPGEQEGYEISRQILKGARLPLSVFCVSDLTALGTIRAARDNNLEIPRDVSILGFDDLSIANFLEPRLSTVHQPRLQMGRSGGELLVALINRTTEQSPDKPTHEVLSPRLMVREST